LIVSALGAGAAYAAQDVTLTLKDHRFTPAEISVPAGQRVRIVLINRDPATEEFDSDDLKLEEVVTPMGQVAFDIGPLQPGHYNFMGEYHAETAQGRVVVEPAR
jgi:plastocyanin